MDLYALYMQIFLHMSLIILSHFILPLKEALRTSDKTLNSDKVSYNMPEKVNYVTLNDT